MLLQDVMDADEYDQEINLQSAPSPALIQHPSNRSRKRKRTTAAEEAQKGQNSFFLALTPLSFFAPQLHFLSTFPQFPLDSNVLC